MKKIVLLATLSLAMFSCSKVGKGEFLITGTAKGIADGKTVILQTQDETTMMTLPLDTVKIKNGKFEFKGKIDAPAMYSLFLPDSKNGFPVIVENDEIKVEVNKDSLQNSKISGTYNNDEFQKFNDQMKTLSKKVQKKMDEFKAKNMQAFETAQKNKDTATVNRLIKESNNLQKEFTDTFTKYAETHPKSFISVLMIDGMFKSPDFDLTKVKKMYDNLSDDNKKTKQGKKIKEQLTAIEKQNPAKKN